MALCVKCKKPGASIQTLLCSDCEHKHFVEIVTASAVQTTDDLPGSATTYSICDHSGSIPMPPDVSAFRWVCKRCGKVSKDGKKWEPQTIDDLPGGSTPSQYALPPAAKELQDLIEHREMNFAMGNIFKACYRKKDVGDPLYDIRKIIWFAKREEARLMKEVDNG